MIVNIQHIDVIPVLEGVITSEAEEINHKIGAAEYKLTKLESELDKHMRHLSHHDEQIYRTESAVSHTAVEVDRMAEEVNKMAESIQCLLSEIQQQDKYTKKLRNRIIWLTAGLCVTVAGLLCIVDYIV